MRARSSLMVGTTPRPPYHAQNRSVSSSTIRSAAGISSRRRAVACAATVCKSSTSYRNTFSSWASAGSTSRGTARSRIQSGFPPRAPITAPTRSQVTTACGAAVEQRAMSVVAKCGHASSSDTARPPSRSAMARARSCVRFATSMICTPSSLRHVAASLRARRLPGFANLPLDLRLAEDHGVESGRYAVEVTHGVAVTRDVTVLARAGGRRRRKSLAEQRPHRLERRLVVRDQIEFGPVAGGQQHPAAGAGSHHACQRARHFVRAMREALAHVEGRRAVIHAYDLDAPAHLRLTRHRNRSAPGCVSLSAT